MQTSGVDSNMDAVVVSAEDIENLASVQLPSAGNTDDQNSSSMPNLPSVLNDISLMCILQQPQPVSGVVGDGGTGMMMMSPSALQSLLVSQMVAAVNSGISCASTIAQSVVTGSETRFGSLGFP